MTVLAAELSDLRGWSAQLGRAGTDCAAASDYLGAHVTDGDFGMILELITVDYERLIPVFAEALAADGARLVATGRSIDAIVRDYAATDARVAQDFGVGAAIRDDSLVGSGFYDVATVLPIAGPTSDAASLPRVSFGFIFDKICDLTQWIIGIDPRDYVTRWIAGDIDKAALQASAWDHVSACLDGVGRSLAGGQRAIDQTWRGAAATSAAAYMDQWLTALPQQSSGTAQIAAHLRDFEREGLAAKGEMLRQVCAAVQATEPRAQITCTIRPQYRNMRYWLEEDMTPVDLARDACRSLGIEAVSAPIRGGTDGSRLTEMGVPTPNLFTGMQNIHGPLEWISVQDMAAATKLCLSLVELAAKRHD